MLSADRIHELHASVINPSSLKLGEVLWFIVKASNMIDELCTSKSKERYVLLSDIEPTAFSQEIIGDEIKWWVKKREIDLEELKRHTEETKAAVQKLKEEARKRASRIQVRSYEDLITHFRDFTITHSNDIEILHQYVNWLYQRDHLAPSILFTNKAWSPTRRTERKIEVVALNLADESLDVIHRLTEIALGLYKGGPRGRYSIESIYHEIKAEMAGSAFGEQDVINNPLMSKVLTLTINEVLDEFAVFFEKIRNSLRFILGEINEYESTIKFMKSEPFWQKFIAKAIQSPKPEPQHWDFKKTLKMWHTKKEPEKSKAKVEFAEDVAAFANSKGGALIIGASNTPVEIDGIGNKLEAEGRLKNTPQVLDERVQYSTDVFYFKPVIIKDKNGDDKLCLVIVIPQNKEVVAVKCEYNRYSYPVRKETGLDRISCKEVAKQKNS